MTIAVIGVTGLVGRTMLQVLEEQDIAISQLIGVASKRSVGKGFLFKGVEHQVVSMEAGLASKPDIAIFSAGGGTSLEWAPVFAAQDCFVIDNSSAWRMDPKVALVVPEINAEAISLEQKIIANPNCSTIQMVLTLAPLHIKYGIKRLVISTYQSYTGTGVVAVKQYNAERQGIEQKTEEKAYAHPIFANCIPHCDVFLDNDYTKEEMKLVHETRKILGDQRIKITATAVRVPVDGGHSESVNLEFDQDFKLEDIKDILNKAPGIVVLDDVKNNVYPTPLNAKNKDAVFVGRIRRDESITRGLNLWIVSDNLRKGAATNAVQIAQYLMDAGLVKNKATV